MLINVLTRLAKDTGYHPEQQRDAIVELLNDAATRMHVMLQCNKMFREVTLAVPADAIVSMPSFIGELRNMRMHTAELPFDLTSIGQPRYTSTTLAYRFKNWRDLGERAIALLPQAYGKLSISVPVVETPNVELLIQGNTNTASSVEEIVTLNAINVETTNLFGPGITKIACLKSRQYDISIKDSDGIEIAKLRNCDSQTRYKIVDVSQVFWSIDTAAQESFINVCYKLPITRLTRDSDSFYAGDEYDTAWYHMALHLYYLPMENRQADSDNNFRLALSAMNSIKDGTEDSILKTVNFGRNKYYGLFRRYRYFPGAVTNVDNTR